MRILITGMTSQQTHESTKNGVTVAGAMAQALRDGGHEVDVRSYSFAESLGGIGTEEYAAVLIGLGPLKGIGTAYMYQAIECLCDSYGKHLFFVDDTETQKIGREFRAILDRPYDYVKPFFSYKREWKYVSPMDGPIFPAHMDAIRYLTGDSDIFAPLLVPSWTFDLAFTAGYPISRAFANNVVSFDPSAFYTRELQPVPSDEDFWATFWKPESPAINRMGVTKWDVEQISSHSWTRLCEAKGTLVPRATWAPEVRLSASIGIPVATDWKILGPQFGEPFEALPALIEMMSEDERRDLADKQAAALVTEKTSRAGVTKILDKIVTDVANKEWKPL